MELLLLIHFIATVFMTGVIWVVQIVIYPQLLKVSTAEFIPYEKSHMNRIGMVVGPMMLLELFTGLYLWIQGMIPEDQLLFFYISIVLGIIIALSTTLIQAPLHGQLAKDGKVIQKIERLIMTNWIRTLCWTGRSVLIGWIMIALME